jgi:MSHA biogenesis protein MshJ
MKLPAGLEAALSRFDRMSLRERGLVAAAILALVIMLWTVALWDPIAARQQSLADELSTMQQTMVTAAETLDATTLNDPATLALKKEEQLRKELADINAQLASQSAGLIPPERMVQVIQDVLARQRGVTLISLHNKPVTTLAKPVATAEAEAFVTTPASERAALDATATGPYVHPVELVIEGPYLDILAYLHTLETLEWRFYWKLLELETVRHPTNRVRIEINTLSMDKDWIGLSLDK